VGSIGEWKSSSCVASVVGDIVHPSSTNKPPTPFWITSNITLNHPRFNHAAVVLDGTKIVVIGGSKRILDPDTSVEMLETCGLASVPPRPSSSSSKAEPKWLPLHNITIPRYGWCWMVESSSVVVMVKKLNNHVRSTVQNRIDGLYPQNVCHSPIGIVQQWYIVS